MVTCCILECLNRFLVAVDRRHGPVVAMETVKLAEDFLHSSDGVVVGLDLSGDPTVSSDYTRLVTYICTLHIFDLTGRSWKRFALYTWKSQELRSEAGATPLRGQSTWKLIYVGILFCNEPSAVKSINCIQNKIYKSLCLYLYIHIIYTVHTHMHYVNWNYYFGCD